MTQRAHSQPAHSQPAPSQPAHSQPAPSQPAHSQPAPSTRLIIEEQKMRDAGFTKGTSGWYYPKEPADHIHLGAFTGPGVPANHYEIRFVSTKIDGRNQGNLPQCPSGKFNLLHGADAWGKYKVPFQQALLHAGIGVEGC